MILLPEFTEDKENSVIMYFPVNGNKKELEKQIESTYYCYSSFNYVTRDEKEYLALEIDNLDE